MTKFEHERTHSVAKNTKRAAEETGTEWALNVWIRFDLYTDRGAVDRKQFQFQTLGVKQSLKSVEVILMIKYKP